MPGSSGAALARNPLVGLILYAHRDNALAHYPLEGLPNKVIAAECRTALPDGQLISEELERTRRALDERRAAKRQPELSRHENASS